MTVKYIISNNVYVDEFQTAILKDISEDNDIAEILDDPDMSQWALIFMPGDTRLTYLIVFLRSFSQGSCMLQEIYENGKIDLSVNPNILVEVGMIDIEGLDDLGAEEYDTNNL